MYVIHGITETLDLSACRGPCRLVPAGKPIQSLIALSSIVLIVEIMRTILIVVHDATGAYVAQ